VSQASVLVAGGAGYVGSHAVQALARAGRDVVVYDNLQAGHREAVDRLVAAFPARSIRFVRGDILDTAKVREAVEEYRVSAVMHFAALLSVGESVRSPLAYYRNNVMGTLSVLEAMAGAGVPHFVFSSTCATFGEPQNDTLDESHPQRPINAYGETKLAIERALPHVERASGIRSVALRYFNASGADPGGLIGEDHRPEEHLIPRAIAAVRGGEALTLFGRDYPTPDGTCIRDYVHVCDLADAHVRALQYLEGGGASTRLNLGSGVGMSVKSVLTAVERVAGAAVPHTIGPRREGDPARLVASSDAAERVLGWKPLHDLDAIVQSAWRWHSTHPDGYGR
jgi:UDP-glucose 4-epimerase